MRKFYHGKTKSLDLMYQTERINNNQDTNY